MTTKALLSRMHYLQLLLNRFLACRPKGRAKSSSGRASRSTRTSTTTSPPSSTASSTWSTRTTSRPSNPTSPPPSRSVYLREARRRERANRKWGWYLHAGATFEEEDCTSDHDDMSPAVEREELLLSGVLAKTRTTSEEACSICLGVLVAGEKERLLPRCRHSFHPHCIDQWFHFRKLPSKLTCPLCRTPTP